MAVIKKDEQPTSLTVEINNGDHRALIEIKERMGFKDKESVLRYALGVLKFAEEGTLCIERKDGTTKALNPIDELLEHRDQKGIAHG